MGLRGKIVDQPFMPSRQNHFLLYLAGELANSLKMNKSLGLLACNQQSLPIQARTGLQMLIQSLKPIPPNRSALLINLTLPNILVG